jgi:hypothetical protein
MTWISKNGSLWKRATDVCFSRVWSSIAQPVPNAVVTPLTYDVADFDPLGSWDIPSGVFTAPVDGYYDVKATNGWATAAATTCWIEIDKNNQTYVRGPHMYLNNTGAGQGIIVQALVPVLAGETITIAARQNGSTTVQTQAGSARSYASIHLVTTG